MKKNIFLIITFAIVLILLLILLVSKKAFSVIELIGKKILERFTDYLPKFKKIIPVDYEKMLTTILQMEEQGMSSEQAKVEAFYTIKGGR